MMGEQKTVMRVIMRVGFCGRYDGIACQPTVDKTDNNW